MQHEEEGKDEEEGTDEAEGTDDGACAPSTA